MTETKKPDTAKKPDPAEGVHERSTERTTTERTSRKDAPSKDKDSAEDDPSGEQV